MILLALDHNFPEPVIHALRPWMGNVRLLPLRHIHPVLTTLDDRELIIMLSQLGLDGLVTLNYKMLRNPRELAAILRTRLPVLAVERVGDDPLRAAGALLLDLPVVARAMQSGASGVFWLRPRGPSAQQPWDLFVDAATRRHEDPQQLYARVRVSDLELKASVLPAR